MWIPIWVNVEKEPANEVDEWAPPGAEIVAKFVGGETVNIDTDDGWVITEVYSKPSAK